MRNVIFLSFALLAWGCSYTPTAPSSVTSNGTKVLRGTVYPMGTTTVWVESPRDGTFALSMTEEKPASGPLAVALGGPTGAEGRCETANPVDLATSSAPAVAPVAAAGLYCIDVSDTGSVTSRSGVDFAITVRFQ